ncbi:hypothetical protein OPV22_020424 [Ensete ventricosum]|uniref:Uncharacterized protein n=1 Tax=Ensete ventricosum TaxID=4639 RepID=A0AAV8QEP7_ENSVE|nr:hypothetical protein OPV22_020424 [Ensete ventricosum]
MVAILGSLAGAEKPIPKLIDPPLPSNLFFFPFTYSAGTRSGSKNLATDIPGNQYRRNFWTSHFSALTKFRRPLIVSSLL